MPADRYSWLKYAAWPAVALVVVILVFRSGVGPASDVELGPIKLKFSAENARKVPRPSDEVAEVLAKLHPAEVDLLLATGDSYAYTCKATGLTSVAESGYAQRSRLFAKLEELRLAEDEPDTRTARASNEVTDAFCNEGQAIEAHLTDKGKEARRYLMEVLTKSIVISPSDE